jgi:2-polyprenyl-6-methoxyphenol hydroxylase-like FAD-dependent oxidoreductase
MRIAISGAGIAGTTLAYWLLRAGHEPVLIEEAPVLRTGGYVVDFWGLGFTLIERMGLLSQVQDRGYSLREFRFVDSHSRKTGGFSMEAMQELAGGRFTTIRRGALVEMIYGALEDQVETIFGDSIAKLEERDESVSVVLRSGSARDFDMVIGADGLHSVVRTLCFGPHSSTYETYLGYLVGAFEVQGYRPRDEGVYVVHPTPSHQLARFALREDRTLFLFVFRSDTGAMPSTQTEIRDILRSEFGNVGWEAPGIVDAMGGVEDIYFDRMSQIRMPSWTKGRVALVGDAAAAVSLLAGEGTGLAMVETYVLAGEIGQASGDYRRAFSEYEAYLRPFIEEKQKTAQRFASSFVPETELGIWARNQATKLMHIPGVAGLLLGKQVRDDFDLPDYPGLFGNPSRAPK